MSAITVWSETEKKEKELDLNESELLSAVRAKLGTFMKPKEAFFAQTGEKLDFQYEKFIRLSNILYSGNLTIRIGTSEKLRSVADIPTTPSEPLQKSDDPLESPASPADKATSPTAVAPEVAAQDAAPGAGEEPKAEKEEPKAELAPEKDEDAPPTAAGKDIEVSAGTESPSAAAPVIGKHKFSKDMTGSDTVLTVDGNVVRGSDRISTLSSRDIVALLQQVNIDQAAEAESAGLTTAFHLTDDGDLKRAADRTMVFQQLDIRPPDTDRISTISYQFSKVESRMHMNSVDAGTASIGIPDLFKVKSSYRQESASRLDEKTVTEHKSYSHIIPRARVVFKDENVTLSHQFTTQIRQAVDADKRNPASADSLLRVLRNNGEFFATDILLGGRLIYWTDKKLSESYSAAKDRQAFTLQAAGQATLEGKPVKVDGSYERERGNEREQTSVEQAATFYLTHYGGDINQVTPQAWIPTLAKYHSWRIAGFNRNSLVPVLEYLQDESLKKECFRLLREHFARSLSFTATEIVGATHETRFGPEENAKVKRIVKIVVNHGINVDGLTVTYEFENGQQKEMPRVGKGRGHVRPDPVVGPFASDEEIVALEIATGDGNLLRRLAFQTNKRRYPEGKNEFYGTGHSGERLTYTTVRAPRVCGLVGYVGNHIDSIGLRYRDFPEGMLSRQFLMAMEPTLFPLSFPAKLDMELTTRGVLLAGEWRDAQSLNRMTSDDKRNTLIVELIGHSLHDGGYLQAMSDDVLAQKAAIVIALKRDGRDPAWLKAKTFEEQRRALIDRIDAVTGVKRAALDALNDEEILRWNAVL